MNKFYFLIFVRYEIIGPQKKSNYCGLRSSKPLLGGGHCVYSPPGTKHCPATNSSHNIQNHSSPFCDKFKRDKSKALLLHATKEYVEMEVIWLHSCSTLVLETAIGHPLPPSPQPNEKPFVPTE